MSKVILALCLLVAVILVACIDTKEFDSDNMEVVGAFRGLRIKRGGICWNTMRRACCNHGCKGDGCLRVMCWACC